jgi:hypothetical protein
MKRCNMIKKKWVRPQLIALVRGRPEELVLGNCKMSNPFYGPDVADGYCYRGSGDPSNPCPSYCNVGDPS